MNRLVHYWDYISIVFGEQDMCRFASFKYEGAECCSQKAIGWIVLLLSNTKAILNVLQTIYSIDFIQRVLYDRDESYISSCRSDLLKIASLLELIELKFEMKVINDFYDYQNEINSNRCHFNSAIQGRVNPFENECDIEEIKEQEDSSILVLHSNNQADCEHNISSSSSEGLDNQILSFNINDNLRLPQVSSINESGDEDQNFISAPANQNGEECSEGQIQTSENIDHSLLINEENKLKLPCLHSNEHISQIENKPKYNISSLKHDIQVGDCIESFDLVESMNLYCHSMLKSSNSSIKAMSSSKLKKRDELRKSHHSRTHTLYSDSCFSESNLIEYLMKNQSEIQIRNKSMPKKVHSKELYLDLCKNLRSMKESRRSESRTGSILLIDEPNSHCRTHQMTSLSIAQSNTERLYNSELMEEIKSGIYSCVRRRIFMAERRKHIRPTHPHLLKAHQLSKNVCAECLKPFKDIQIKNASFLTKVMNKLSVSTKIRTCEFCHNNVCSNCLAEIKLPIPSFILLTSRVQLKSLCKRSSKFLLSLPYLKLPDGCLPAFQAQRQQLHELADKLSADCFSELLADVEEYRNLLLGQCYVTGPQLGLLADGRLLKVVKQRVAELKAHMRQCRLCRNL